jgi:hypothetical protein
MWLAAAPKRPFNPNRFHFNFRWDDAGASKLIAKEYHNGYKIPAV